MTLTEEQIKEVCKQAEEASDAYLRNFLNKNPNAKLGGRDPMFVGFQHGVKIFNIDPNDNNSEEV